ncbi:MAG TPA: hypothetical protein PLP33_14555 [Leptospiraceae bacterium]|nr:hypothetical protein [Leptospiraceae bacterium]
MKKASLKTTTMYSEPNMGTTNSRASKTSTAEGGKPYDSSDWQIKADTSRGVGTATSRYADTKASTVAQPSGLAQPLRTNSPMKEDTSLIGPGVYTTSTPLRKRKG